MLHVKKSQLAKLVAKGRVHESFVHSTCGTFDITLMREFAQKNVRFSADGEVRESEVELVLLTINEEVKQFIMQSRDVEEERIMELSEESWDRDPIMGVHYPDGTTLLIDGHHRILRRLIEGKTDVIAYMFKPEQIIRPQTGWGDMKGVEWGNKTFVDGELVPISNQSKG